MRMHCQLGTSLNTLLGGENTYPGQFWHTIWHLLNTSFTPECLNCFLSCHDFNVSVLSNLCPEVWHHKFLCYLQRTLLFCIMHRMVTWRPTCLRFVDTDTAHRWHVHLVELHITRLMLQVLRWKAATGVQLQDGKLRTSESTHVPEGRCT